MDRDPTQSREAESLNSRARLERISEPWALNRNFAIICTLAMAVLLGSWVAGGEFENLILLVVGLSSALVIIFVQDYWWSPPLVISALGLTTMALGFPIGGLDFGVVILALTFPVKMAMKTLRKAEPEMSNGTIYWILLGYVTIHFIVIIIYNKIDGAPQLRNIIKSYYLVLVPLIFAGLMIRYAHPRTVRLTMVILYGVTLFVAIASSITLLLGIEIPPLTELRISIGWLDAEGGAGVTRTIGPYIFIASLAFWPVYRSGYARFWMTLGVAVGMVATLMSGGRLSFLLCVMAGVFFAVIRGKLWLCLPFLAMTAAFSAIISANPDIYFSMPQLIQRATAPFNFSIDGADTKEVLQASDDWHKVLREQSIPYWMQDTTSFWLGHGFKSWDPNIPRGDISGFDYEHFVSLLAIQMGLLRKHVQQCHQHLWACRINPLHAAYMLHIAWQL